MPDKQTLAPDEKKDDWQIKAKPQPTVKKIKGKVILIIPGNRVIIEYGSGYATDIPYNVEKHKSLKLGDIIEV